MQGIFLPLTMFSVVRLGLDAVVLDLFAQGFHGIKFSFVSCLFDELYSDLLAVKFLVKIEDVSLHVFLEFSDCRLYSYVGDARIFYAVVKAVSDVNTVGRSYHGFVQSYV